MLSSFRAGEKIRHSVILRLQKVGATANGGVFARGTVQDSTGNLGFISFDQRVADFLKNFASSGAVVIYGTAQVDKYAGDGTMQIIIDQIELPREDEDLSHLLPCTPKDIKQYKQYLQELIDELTKPHLKELLNCIFSGETYDKFIKNPAAMRHHHAYLGGLLEHSVDVAKLAKVMALEIGNADVELVVAGALLHDIGKLREISPDIGFEYTDAGKFIGHLTLGAFMVERAMSKIKDFPKEEALELMHILLSHHGTHEKGSPMACATKESFIVHYADELNSVLYHFEEKDEKSPWQYNKSLSRQIFVKGHEEPGTGT